MDTDLKIEIMIRLKSICFNGLPRCCVKINDTIQYDDYLLNVVDLKQNCGLLDPICVEIIMSDKKYSQDKETAILIDQISFDGFELVPNYTHLAQYINEKSMDHPTSYLGFNGVWRFQMAEPFYVWRHRVTGQGWLLTPTSLNRC